MLSWCPEIFKADQHLQTDDSAVQEGTLTRTHFWEFQVSKQLILNSQLVPGSTFIKFNNFMSFLFREMVESFVYRFLQIWCSQKFRKTHIKTPVPKSRFNKVAEINPGRNSRFCEFFQSIFCKVHPLATVSKVTKEALENCFFYQIMPVDYLKLFGINFSRSYQQQILTNILNIPKYYKQILEIK